MTDRNAIMINNCAQIYQGDYLVLNKEMDNSYQVSFESVQKCNQKIRLLPEYDSKRFIVYKIIKHANEILSKRRLHEVVKTNQ